MIKKLVYFLYIGDDLTPNGYMEKYPTMKLHYKMLNYYHNVFDESVFVLSLKKELMENYDLIKRFMDSIIDLGFYNVRFKIEENTDFRESKTFKEEVIEKKDNEGKLVFFGHNKGTTNEYNESLVKLICSMYYFNLNFIDDVEHMLIGNECAYYGFPLLNAHWSEPEATCVMPKYKYFIYGTFFWTNIDVMKEIMYNKKREWPQMCSRFYAENFPGNTIEFEMVGTYKNTYMLSGKNLHYDFDTAFNEYCEYAPEGEKIKNNFEIFVNYIKEMSA